MLFLRGGRITWIVSPPQAGSNPLFAAILELSGYCVNAVRLYVNAADALVRRGVGMAPEAFVRRGLQAAQRERGCRAELGVWRACRRCRRLIARASPHFTTAPSFFPSRRRRIRARCSSGHRDARDLVDRHDGGGEIRGQLVRVGEVPGARTSFIGTRRTLPAGTVPGVGCMRPPDSAGPFTRNPRPRSRACRQGRIRARFEQGASHIGDVDDAGHAKQASAKCSGVTHTALGLRFAGWQ